MTTHKPAVIAPERGAGPWGAVDNPRLLVLWGRYALGLLRRLKVQRFDDAGERKLGRFVDLFDQRRIGGLEQAHAARFTGNKGAAKIAYRLAFVGELLAGG